jgi:hypothetical protein
LAPHEVMNKNSTYMPTYTPYKLFGTDSDDSDNGV